VSRYTGVTVVDATGAAPRPDMTRVISAGRIDALGREALDWMLADIERAAN